jgi:pimeloyl-ACP methyl ester carboxylesterase
MYRSFHYQLTDRIEDKAPRITVPVLVVRGEHDPIANQRWCEQITGLCGRDVWWSFPKWRIPSALRRRSNWQT